MPRPTTINENVASRSAHHSRVLRASADDALGHVERAAAALKVFARELAAFDRMAEDVAAKVTDALGEEPSAINRTARFNRAGTHFGRVLSTALGEVSHLGPMSLSSGPVGDWLEQERIALQGIVEHVEKLAAQAA